MLVIDLYHLAAKLSLKSFVFERQSPARPEFSEACRAKSKLFILLRLNMAAV